MIRTLVLVAAATVVLAGALSAAATRASISPRALVSASDLPGHDWAFPLTDAQTGRVGKAFAAAHAVGCPGFSTAVAPQAAAATFLTRRGHGLSLGASLVATYRLERDARAVFHAALSPRLAGCLARSLTGPAPGASVEAWVVPSPLRRAGRGTSAERIALAYAATAPAPERWMGYLDLVNARSGRTWAIYVFFASKPADAERYERLILGRALDGLGSPRATQAMKRPAASTQQCDPAIDCVRQARVLEGEAQTAFRDSCNILPAMIRATAALDRAIDLLTEARPGIERVAQLGPQVDDAIGSNTAAKTASCYGAVDNVGDAIRSTDSIIDAYDFGGA